MTQREGQERALSNHSVRHVWRRNAKSRAMGEKESIADYIHKADKDATVVAYKRFALGE